MSTKIKKIMFWTDPGFSWKQWSVYHIDGIRLFFSEIKAGWEDARVIKKNMKLVRETKRAGHKVVINLEPTLIAEMTAKNHKDLVMLAAMLTSALQYHDCLYGTGVRDILAFNPPKPEPKKKGFKMSVKDIRKKR